MASSHDCQSRKGLTPHLLLVTLLETQFSLSYMSTCTHEPCMKCTNIQAMLHRHGMRIYSPKAQYSICTLYINIVRYTVPTELAIENAELDMGIIESHIYTHTYM